MPSTIATSVLTVLRELVSEQFDDGVRALDVLRVGMPICGTSLSRVIEPVLWDGVSERG